LLDDAPETAIPMPLDGHTRYRVRAFELSDPAFDSLYRELTGQPETPKPTLGDVIKARRGWYAHCGEAVARERGRHGLPIGREFLESVLERR
jgi:hypothetical protein